MSEFQFPIRCSRCGEQTGAVFAGGDPYLPHILCTACAANDDAAADDEEDR